MSALRVRGCLEGRSGWSAESALGAESAGTLRRLLRRPRNRDTRPPREPQALSRVSPIDRDLEMLRAAKERAQGTRVGIGIRQDHFADGLTTGHDFYATAARKAIEGPTIYVGDQISKPIDAQNFSRHLLIADHGRRYVERLPRRQRSAEGGQLDPLGHPRRRGRKTVASLERPADRRAGVPALTE